MKHHINRMHTYFMPPRHMSMLQLGHPSQKGQNMRPLRRKLVLTIRLFQFHVKLSCTLNTFWHRRREADQEAGTSQQLKYGFKTHKYFMLLLNKWKISEIQKQTQQTAVTHQLSDNPCSYSWRGRCVCVSAWGCYVCTLANKRAASALLSHTHLQSRFSVRDPILFTSSFPVCWWTMLHLSICELTMTAQIWAAPCVFLC